MSTLLFVHGRDGVPADEATVRSTTAIVNQDAPASEMPDSPGWNETETDTDPYIGMTGRQLASHVVPSEQYVNPMLGATDSYESGMEQVNRQVSSAGSAAQREAAGEWGHGTLKVVEGIEPTIVDGHEMTDQFAKMSPVESQSGVTAYMTPSDRSDRETVAAMAATGALNSRRAAANSQYAAFYDNFQAGL